MANYGLTTDSTSAGFVVKTVIENSAIVATKTLNKLRDYITFYNKPVYNFKVPILSNAPFTALTQNTAITPTDMDLTGPTLTAIEYGAGAYRSDLLGLATDVDLLASLGQEWAAQAIAIQNQKIFSLGTGLSQSVGDTTTAINIANIRTGVRMLELAGVRPDPYYNLLVTPYVMEDLRKELFDTTGNVAYTSAYNEFAMEGVIPTLPQVRVRLVTDLATSDMTGASISCPLIGKQAFAINVVKDIDVETGRDIWRKAEGITASTVFGYAEFRDTHGVKVVCANND